MINLCTKLEVSSFIRSKDREGRRRKVYKIGAVVWRCQSYSVVALPSYCVPILCCFWDMAGYWLKLVNFTYTPPTFGHPVAR